MALENPNSGQNNPSDQLLERARNVIRELREKLTAAEAANKPAPIAIIGMACDFPGVRSDLDAFWNMTVEGRDAVSMIPADRWDREALYAHDAPTAGKMNTRRAAFLGDIARFDAAFFDVPPIEANRMDPQQRIFLETAWHAIEDAGLSREMLSGSETGVFVGVHSQSMDYYALQASELDTLDAYAATGTAQDVIAGRLAYWLNLHGPSMAVNTACSSSLVALHLACRSLRAGDCSAAISGGVNLLLSPATSVAAAQLQMLAPDGLCKAFDSQADGFGRGEGCGVVVLKRLADAERDADRILAIIRGSAINQDGRTNGLTAPNGLAQQRLLRRALENAGIAPSMVGYIEAHGTGTTLGDPIEVEALAEVLSSETRTFPCALGSVKANIGHLEGAAGIAGVIKAVLVLRNGFIPPVANLKKLNPHLALQGSGLEIPMKGHVWERSGPRLAGVSSFGWSGTNAHFILEEAPKTSTSTAGSEGSVVIAVSAQSVDALSDLAMAYADLVQSASKQELYDIGFTSTMRRTHHSHRIAVEGETANEIAAMLRARVASFKQTDSMVQSSRAFTGKNSDPLRLITLYEHGSEARWKDIYPVRSKVVELPRYPFKGKRYWLNPSVGSKSKQVEPAAPDDWFYAVNWLNEPLVSTTQSAPNRSWLILDMFPSLEEGLAAVVRENGHEAIMVSAGDSLARISADRYTVPASGASKFEGLFELVVSNGVVPNHVVFVAGTGSAEELTADALELAQGVVRGRLDLKLWFLTQGAAQSLPQDDSHLDVSHAALWGFSRVFGLEQPDLSGGVIDISIEGEIISGKQLRAVFDEIASHTAEDRVAIRAGQRYVPRLVRCNDDAPRERIKIRNRGSYLITGAFGSIGMHLAEWLAKRGASNLILVGRRTPSDTHKPDLQERIELLRSKGVTVNVVRCDIAEASNVESLFLLIEQNNQPLCGVIHAAAAVSFNPIEQATRAKVESAFQAKVEGAKLLDLQTRHHNLDFFVAFSSASASIGARNACLYAASNSSLNALMVNRRRLNLAASSIQWGLWDNSAAIGQRDLIAKSGFLPMKPALAIDALERLLGSDAPATIVASIDWQTLQPALEMQGRSAFVQDINADPRAPAHGDLLVHRETIPNEPHSLVLAIKDAPERDRIEHLMVFVGEEAKAVFGMPSDEPIDEERGLFQMGMNSLMSVELKKRLESKLALKLPGTLTLTYPTVTALAKFLDRKLFPEQNLDSTALRDVAHANHDRAKVTDDELSSLAEMDDAETDAAIAAELEAIHQKLGAH